MRTICAASWLDEDGDKAALVARLVAFDAPAEGWPPAPAATSDPPRPTRVAGALGNDALRNSADNVADSQLRLELDRTGILQEQYEGIPLPGLKKMARGAGVNPNGARPDLIQRLIANELAATAAGDDDAVAGVNTRKHSILLSLGRACVLSESASLLLVTRGGWLRRW